MASATLNTWYLKLPPIVLIGASALMLIAMSHHPVLESGTSSNALTQMVAMARIDRVVHGALIALLGAVLLAHVELSARLGWNHAAVRAAILLYTLGVFLMFGAALVDGFSLSWLAESYARAPSPDYESFRHLLRAMMLGAVQPLTSLGALLMAFGVIGWSVAIGSRMRWLAAVGVISAALPIVGLLSGWLLLDKQGATMVLICQCLWNVAIGVQWLRNPLSFATAA